MDPISLILFIAIGGIMIGAGVHFIPVGGAPAAMATATGVGTGFNRINHCCSYG